MISSVAVFDVCRGIREGFTLLGGGVGTLGVVILGGDCTGIFAFGVGAFGMGTLVCFSSVLTTPCITLFLVTQSILWVLFCRGSTTCWYVSLNRERSLIARYLRYLFSESKFTPCCRSASPLTSAITFFARSFRCRTLAFPKGPLRFPSVSTFT